MGLFASLDELFERPGCGGRVCRCAARPRLPQRLRLHREAALSGAFADPYRLRCADRRRQPSVSAADLQRRAPDLARLAAFCDTHGFGSLLRRQAERLTAHARAA